MSTTREIRTLTRAQLKRSQAISGIEAILAMSKSVSTNPLLVPKFLEMSLKTEMLWANFETENDAVLDALIELERSSEFPISLSSETREMCADIAAARMSLMPDAINDATPIRTSSIPNAQDQSTGVGMEYPRSSIRLPEIPLPRFSGELSSWPIFSDRFLSLIEERPHLSNVERYHYLCGALDGEAADVIKGFVMSSDNYPLAWAALVERYHKPRQLANILVERLLSTPVQTQESISGLREFIQVFDENVQLLHSLAIPDVGAFLLFFLAMRCLPLSIRKLFESSSTAEFPVVGNVITFIKERVRILENAGGSRVSDSRQRVTTPRSWVQGNTNVKRCPQRVLVATEPNQSSKLCCSICSGPHLSTSCARFAAMNSEKRRQLVLKKRLCFNCLSGKHWTAKCLSNSVCDQCFNKHHTLLHREAPPISQPETDPRPSTASLMSCQPIKNVLLGTALIHVRDQWGHQQSLRAVIDSGSQANAITTSCIERLGLRVSKWTVPLTGLSGAAIPMVAGIVECHVTPRYDVESELEVKAWVLPTITADMPRCSLPPAVKLHFDHLALADPTFDQCGPVDVLLGADVFSVIMDGKRIVGKNGLPTAFGSIFGWVLIGAIAVEEVIPSSMLLTSVSPSLEQLLTKFWTVEEPEPCSDDTLDARCAHLVAKDMRRELDGRYSVPLPFHTSGVTMRDSRRMALKRFENLERRLNRDSALHTAYVDFMRQYEDLGHMCEATRPGTYFIPHHPVVKGVEGDMKVRVVFDASAKSGTSASLNECIYAGPKLQSDIVDVLILFRTHTFVFSTDICKMYRQIWIHPQHRVYQHILWRESSDTVIREYELNTVTYGVSCAPYLAIRVLHDLADNATAFPAVQQALRHHTYVDDICTGADSIECILQLQRELRHVLGEAGFILKKWASNVQQVIEQVPEEDRVMGAAEFVGENTDTLKLLGLVWSPTQDNFSFTNLVVDAATTKRGVLSSIARLYDPLGFLAPVIFEAKTIMQCIWQANCAWDDPLPVHIQSRWATWIADLPNLAGIKIPRCMQVQEGSIVQLVGFCDASKKGYAALAYLRVVSRSGSCSVFYVGGKTKLAPIKSDTIPRLELCAAVLLARWLARLKLILSSRFCVTDVFAWSDSSVVLSWLTTTQVSFKVFVTHRVGQIHSLLPGCVWRYVPSQLNPADCASRGLHPHQLIDQPLYWHGPSFLTTPLDEWSCVPPHSELSDLPEITPTRVMTVQIREEWFAVRSSSLTRVIRLVAWMRRFVNACRGNRRQVCILTREETDEALICVIKSTQRFFFGTLYSELTQARSISVKHLLRLSPFLDDDGIIRVGGRLRYATIPSSQKFPILLSKCSHLSWMLCKYWHVISCHGGAKLITAMVTRQYWILSARVVARKVVTQCITCVKHAAVTPQPKMADLPECRVRESRPFSHVGIDYAGPFRIQENRLRKAREYKVYLSVFVCMSVKAVHFELVSDLTTDAFIAALDRFVSRRGCPDHLYSDCGTNFVGAANVLRQLVNDEANHEMLTRATSCVWHFNAPGAPHFGGIWEAAVKSTKRLLIRTVGPHILTWEELLTIVTRIEAVLNSRPLFPLSDDPSDLECLTPGHFLIGQPLLAPPERSTSEGVPDLRRRWTLLKQCHQSFWRQWSTEYLQTLQVRSKWGRNHVNIKVDDLVIIKDNPLPSLQWRLGRIVDVLPGPDGIVRVAKIRTQSGIIVRPVVKLVPLPSAPV